ncbi:hypothetical protein ACFU9O_01450, partial [Streptomyces albidoflavus]
VTRYEVDKFGRVIGEAEGEAAAAGSNVVTSIDSRVQAVAEQELIGAMEEARAQTDEITGRPYGAGHAHSQERRGRSDGTIPPHAHLHRPRRHPSRLPRRW